MGYQAIRKNGFWHGADYYPEQWLDDPAVLEEDIRMMKLAGINVVTMGVFAWSALEPEEGKYTFEWLEERMECLYRAEIDVILATPSGARPAWLARRYPEVLRTGSDRSKNLYGMRMNHCYTSPAYRMLVGRIDRELARHFGSHPALKAWHISNEYHGECHCGLCQEAFRCWLKIKYGDLDSLNRAWWTAFWSKTYTSWDQIESPSPVGERAVMGLNLDWKRFVTDQTKSFMDMEIEAVRTFSPDVPVTTNMIGSFTEIDYPRLASSLDIASIDIYPEWRPRNNVRTALDAGFEYDVIRCLKKQPFLLMETTPSMTSWTEFCKPKHPGQHLASCIQAVAHGATSVQYFQWRKSRGAFEKFHGAVIGHSGHEHTRVFREVSQVGEVLGNIPQIAEAETRAETAILYDWNNRWALDGAVGLRREKKHEEIVREHYRALRRCGKNVDVIEEEADLSCYNLVIAPMLYMLKKGLAERLTKFAAEGGTLVLSYLSGIVDENDLCFLGGVPGPLRKLAGVWCEEMDPLCPEEKVNCLMKSEVISASLSESECACSDYCDVLHLEGAEAVAVYQCDAYYDGFPALTCNRYGKGRVWYQASRFSEEFLVELYRDILSHIEKKSCRFLSAGLPYGVEYSSRDDRNAVYHFFTNWNDRQITLKVYNALDYLTGNRMEEMTTLNPFQSIVIQEQCPGN